MTIRRLSLGILTALAFLIIVLGFNVWRIDSPTSLPSVPPADDLIVNSVEAAARLAASVRFRTISQSAGSTVAEPAFLDMHAFLVEAFPNVHARLKREVINGFSLLYTWEGTDPSLKAILLSAHQDVVPVEPGTENDWEYGPFEGVVADGYVWGRGTLDMKSGMMGILEAVESLLAADFTPTRTIYLAFGHDEEIGGNQGAAAIAERLRTKGAKLDFSLDEGLVVTEGIMPGVTRPVALIGIAEKGLVTLRLSAKGLGGHGSMPPSQTATGRLARAIARLEAEPIQAHLQPPVTTMFNTVVSEMPLTLRVAIANRWIFKPLILARLSSEPATNALIRSTLAVSIIKAGVKRNVIPQEAEAIIDVRLIPGDTVSSVIDHVRRVIDQTDVTVEIAPGTQLEASPISDTDSESYQQLVRTARHVFPDAVVAPGLLVGTTDTRHYLELADDSYRFLPLRISPDDVMRFHGTDERISIDNYLEIVRFYAQLVRNAA